MFTTEEEVDNLIRDIFGEDGEHADIVEDDVEIDELPNAESDIDSNIWSNIQNDSEEYQHLKERKFVVGEKAILDLLKRSSCKECKEPVDPSSITEGEKIASGIKFKFVCKNGHEGKWISTPFYGARSVVNMMLQLMVLLSGVSLLLVYSKYIHRDICLFSFEGLLLKLGSALGLLWVTAVSFTDPKYTLNRYRKQTLALTAIKSYFLSHIDKARQSLGGIPLSIAVDVRYNSPGFSANKSTAVFMDSKTHTILHLEIGDSREVDRHSPRMEKILVEKGLKYLVHHSPLVIWEVISDASRTITALMKTANMVENHWLERDSAAFKELTAWTERICDNNLQRSVAIPNATCNDTTGVCTCGGHVMVVDTRVNDTVGNYNSGVVIGSGVIGLLLGIAFCGVLNFIINRLRNQSGLRTSVLNGEISVESINSNVTCNELSNNEEEGIDIYNHLHEDNIELSVQSDYEYVQQQVTEEDEYSHVTTFNPNHIQISGDYGVIS
uniref:Uncharacterized protein n=1 Tax=Magallana gigas TaxID=29159 RepID=K1PZM4_MAGGI